MMKLTASSIELNDIRLYAFHGVLDQERRVGGDYSVSLRVHYNISKAMKTDRVDDTLNYVVLLDIVKEQMAIPSDLMEHVAARIAQAVFSRFPDADATDVMIVKLNPPLGVMMAGAAVNLHLINDKTQ